MLLITLRLLRDGLIFFPEFCKVILRKFREDNVDSFGATMFKVMGWGRGELFPDDVRQRYL